MRTHSNPLSDVTRYLANNRGPLEDKRPEFDSYLRVLRRYISVGPAISILEIGTGTGWFPLLCKLEGISCTGLEISPQLVEHGREWGRQYGVEPDLRLGNIEEGGGLPEQSYDAIIANSVFEHVECWQPALGHVYRALKPGGVFFFISTNKFSPVSAEYAFPLYGWLPDRWRYRLRVARQGPDIMKLGIDFNQFTYPQLRRAFRAVGFSRICDRIDVADQTAVSSPLKRAVLTAASRSSLAKWFVLTFCEATIFACVK
jgi:SAM-dependent methyltransferase